LGGIPTPQEFSIPPQNENFSYLGGAFPPKMEKFQKKIWGGHSPKSPVLSTVIGTFCEKIKNHRNQKKTSTRTEKRNI